MSLTTDIIWGAKAIADHIGVPQRRVYYWAELREAGENAPPILKERRIVYARASELDSYFSGGRGR